MTTIAAGPYCPTTRSEQGRCYAGQPVVVSGRPSPGAVVLFCLALAHDQRARRKTANDRKPRARWVGSRSSLVRGAGR